MLVNRLWFDRSQNWQSFHISKCTLFSYKKSFENITNISCYIYVIVYFLIDMHFLSTVLAFNVTPLTWTFVLFDREFTAWRLYYISCCIPSILGFIILSFLPETPKMLMENGYLPKAYDLFRRIYVINTRLHIDTYPVKI